MTTHESRTPETDALDDALHTGFGNYPARYMRMLDHARSPRREGEAMSKSAFEQWMDTLDPQWREKLELYSGSGFAPDLEAQYDELRDCWKAALTRAAEICRGPVRTVYGAVELDRGEADARAIEAERDGKERT